MRRILNTIAATIIIGVTLAFGTACVDKPVTQSVCVMKITKTRVDDNRCTNRSLLYQWIYLAPGQYVPPVGARATQGTFKKPTSGKIRYGVSREGAATKKPTTKSTPTKTKSKSSVFKPKSNSGSKSGGSRSK